MRTYPMEEGDRAYMFMLHKYRNIFKRKESSTHKYLKAINQHPTSAPDKNPKFNLSLAQSLHWTIPPSACIKTLNCHNWYVNKKKEGRSSSGSTNVTILINIGNIMERREHRSLATYTLKLNWHKNFKNTNFLCLLTPIVTHIRSNTHNRNINNKYVYNSLNTKTNANK